MGYFDFNFVIIHSHLTLVNVINIIALGRHKYELVVQ